MRVRTYCRRSKNDEGKQQFSLDVQQDGCAQMIDLSGEPCERYVDDGRAGDDFLHRAGLRKLLSDAKRDDVIICRDQSRLGRDAIEVTLVVRDLVRDRGCRLYYYANGQEVQFANAIDQPTTFILGTGHQMELRRSAHGLGKPSDRVPAMAASRVALATGTASNVATTDGGSQSRS